MVRTPTYDTDTKHDDRSPKQRKLQKRIREQHRRRTAIGHLPSAITPEAPVSSCCSSAAVAVSAIPLPLCGFGNSFTRIRIIAAVIVLTVVIVVLFVCIVAIQMQKQQSSPAALLSIAPIASERTKRKNISKLESIDDDDDSLYRQTQSDMRKKHHNYYDSKKNKNAVRNSVRPLTATTTTGEVVAHAEHYYYSKFRIDRTGAAIYDIVLAHAYCYQYHLNYVGVCQMDSSDFNTTSTTNTEQQQQQQNGIYYTSLQKTLGITSIQKFVLCPTVTNSTTMQQNHILLDGPNTYRKYDSRYMVSDEWRNSVFSSAAEKTIEKHRNNTDVYNIIIHVRRGDVTPCSNSERYLPNAHYTEILDKLLLKYNITDHTSSPLNVTIFSESPAANSIIAPSNRTVTALQQQQYEDEMNLSVFQDRNYTICLDTDIHTVWNTILHHSNMVLLSKSTFSFVPAILLQRQSVIIGYTRFWHHPLPHWDVFDFDAESSYQLRQLQKDC